MTAIVRLYCLSLVLVLMVISTTCAQDCPCDTIRSSYGLAYLFLDNPPGVTAINRDLQRVGYPSLPETGIEFLGGDEYFLSALRGLEVLYMSNIRLAFTYGGLSAIGVMDSLNRFSSTNLSMYRFDMTYILPLIVYGGFTFSPVAGMGEELTTLALERKTAHPRTGMLEDFLDDRSVTFNELGLSLTIGAHGAFSIPLDGKRHSHLEISLRPVYSVRVWNMLEFESDGLAQPEHSRFMLQLGIGYRGEREVCVVHEKEITSD
jgi:hypothetical protein